MRKRPLFERVGNYLKHYPDAKRILVHPDDLKDFLLPGNCKSPVTGKVLPLIVLGTDIQLNWN